VYVGKFVVREHVKYKVAQLIYFKEGTSLST